MSTFSAGKRTIVNIPASGNAPVAITSTAASRRVDIVECPPGGDNFTGGNFAPQGINYSRPDDGFVAVFPLLPDATLELFNAVAEGRGAGALQGGPAQSDPAGRTIAAAIYCKMVSASAVATQVLVIEYA